VTGVQTCALPIFKLGTNNYYNGSGYVYVTSSNGAAQLNVGGIMLIPLGEGETQEMVWLKKVSVSNFDKKILGNFKFVPLLQNKSGS
jgi:hypothetical protein